MNLSLIKEGSISTLYDLLKIEEVDTYSVFFFITVNYDPIEVDVQKMVDDIDYLKNKTTDILAERDVKVIDFIAEFLQHQFNSDFIHVSCFVNHEIDTLFYQIYRKDSESENVWLTIIDLEETLKKLEAEEQIEQITKIKNYFMKLMELL